jgi:hypothetical protein
LWELCKFENSLKLRKHIARAVASPEKDKSYEVPKTCDLELYDVEYGTLY